jgi:hypothetical protein
MCPPFENGETAIIGMPGPVPKKSISAKLAAELRPYKTSGACSGAAARSGRAHLPSLHARDG